LIYEFFLVIFFKKFKNLIETLKLLHLNVNSQTLYLINLLIYVS